MITKEVYEKAKEQVARLENEIQEQKSILLYYEEQQKQHTIKQAHLEIDRRINDFWRGYYDIAFKAIQSRSVVPENFMRKYGYSEHKLKALLRFQFTTGKEFLQFAYDTGLFISIEGGDRTCILPSGVISNFEDCYKQFKYAFTSIAFAIYSKTEQGTFENVIGIDSGYLKRMMGFDIKSAKELATLLYVFKFTLKVNYKTDEIVL